MRSPRDAPTRRVAPALLAVALVTAAGCGGANGDFNASYKQVDGRLTGLGQDVNASIHAAPGRPDTAIATEFAAFAARLDAIRSTFAKVAPPSADAADASRLSTSMGRASADLTGIARAARAHDTKAAQAAAQALVADSASLGAARRSLAQKAGTPAAP